VAFCVGNLRGATMVLRLRWPVLGGMLRRKDEMVFELPTVYRQG
jgi:hypothetical protein